LSLVNKGETEMGLFSERPEDEGTYLSAIDAAYRAPRIDFGPAGTRVEMSHGEVENYITTTVGGLRVLAEKDMARIVRLNGVPIAVSEVMAQNPDAIFRLEPGRSGRRGKIPARLHIFACWRLDSSKHPCSLIVEECLPA
jgi:hypothetical protein